MGQKDPDLAESLSICEALGSSEDGYWYSVKEIQGSTFFSFRGGKDEAPSVLNLPDNLQ